MRSTFLSKHLKARALTAQPADSSTFRIVVYLSWRTTRTTIAERRAEQQCRRRGASSGQKTKRGIEGEDPAAAGIERFFSLQGPREKNNGRASFIINHRLNCLLQVLLFSQSLETLNTLEQPLKLAP